MELLFERMFKWPLEDTFVDGSLPIQFTSMNTKQTYGYFDFI
jgi:hypothetical protein